MNALDDRLTIAGSEVADSQSMKPIADMSTIVHRARRQRVATTMGIVAVISVIAGAGRVAAGLGDAHDQTLEVAERGADGPSTTIGGDSGVSALDEVPALVVQADGWQLYEATESSPAADAEGAAEVPARHARYIRPDNSAALVSVDLFGVPPGSFYESMISLLSASDGYSTVQIRGAEGRLEASDGMFLLAWRESRTTIVALSISGVPDAVAALEIADSLAPVTEDQWNEMLASQPPDAGSTDTTLAN